MRVAREENKWKLKKIYKTQTFHHQNTHFQTLNPTENQVEIHDQRCKNEINSGRMKSESPYLQFNDNNHNNSNVSEFEIDVFSQPLNTLNCISICRF